MPRKAPNAAPAIVSERYQRLIRHLQDREGDRRGWQVAVAKQLGILPQALSNILAGSRRVGWNLARQTAERVRLDPRYFSEGNAEDWLLAWDLSLVDPEDVSDLPPASLGALRDDARSLLERAHRTPPDRLRLRGQTLAQRVLDSRLVRTAHRMRAAPSAAAPLTIELARTLLDERDLADAYLLLPPEARHEAWLHELRREITRAITRYLDAAHDRPNPLDDVRGAVEAASRADASSTFGDMLVELAVFGDGRVPWTPNLELARREATGALAIEASPPFADMERRELPDPPRPLQPRIGSPGARTKPKNPRSTGA